MTDIELAFDTIKGKRTNLDTLWSYANGGQPLKYSTQRLAEAFNDINTHFELNWCSVIVDATLDRINLTGFDTRQAPVDKRLKELFANLHMDIESYKTHNAALVTSEAYVIAWKDGDETELYYNDPRLCAVFYESAHPKVKRFAAKWFVNDGGLNEMTLYYPDRIEHWMSEKKDVYAAKDFTFTTSEPNSFGVIPVFELTSPGEFVKVASMQDAVNKLFADMMVAAEFGAFVQRWVIADSDPGQLKNGPNQIWWIPGGDGQGQQASVGQFDPTNLEVYLKAMDQIANNMAIITRTPKHYFMALGSNISGEALMTMESPLTKKVERRQKNFTPEWQEIASFLLKMDGLEVPPADITVLWQRPETVQVYTEAQARQLAVNTGIPLITVLRREGWTDVEIEKMQKDQELQDKARKTVAQAVLNDLRIRQQQENPFNAQEQAVAEAGGVVNAG
jgi:hypothetical protein